MLFKFGTKAETLGELFGRTKSAAILPQFRFTVKNWRESSENLKKEFFNLSWSAEKVIIRSSGLSEDSENNSLAGKYVSIQNVHGPEELNIAVAKVIDGFGTGIRGGDQIFIQPQLNDVKMSGVAFTRDLSTGGHYYVINYDSISGQTDTITSGRSNEISTYYQVKDKNLSKYCNNDTLLSILYLLHELENITGSDCLDIEFAIAEDLTLYLLQVRPLDIPDQHYISSSKQLAHFKFGRGKD